MRWPLAVFVFFTSITALSGCQTASKMADVVLEGVGIKKPEIPDIQKPPRNVALKLHAGENLNAADTDKPLSLIARVYKLKQTGTFYSAPYDAFLSPEKEKALLGADLIEVREVNLVPGQLYQVVEKVSREASHVGVVTLFRSPAPQRWRIAFAAADAEKSGVTLGLHACSFTLGQGATPDPSSLATIATAPARCQ